MNKVCVFAASGSVPRLGGFALARLLHLGATRFNDIARHLQGEIRLGMQVFKRIEVEDKFKNQLPPLCTYQRITTN